MPEESNPESESMHFQMLTSINNPINGLDFLLFLKILMLSGIHWLLQKNLMKKISINRFFSFSSNDGYIKE
jgi:hypothetical protein